MRRQATAQAIDLYVLDACGFAPTVPTTSTWARVGTCVIVPDAAPHGRRVTVSGALAPYSPPPRLADHSRCGKIDSAAFVAFLWRTCPRHRRSCPRPIGGSGPASSCWTTTPSSAAPSLLRIKGMVTALLALMGRVVPLTYLALRHGSHELDS